MGNYQNNSRKGFGIFSSKEYNYRGDWLNGKRSGLGYFQMNGVGGNPGTTYFGQWNQDVRSGLGIFKAGEQEIRAEWLDDVLHGRVCIGAYTNKTIFMRYEHGKAVEQLSQGLDSFLALFVPLDLNRFMTFAQEKENQIKELLRSAKQFYEEHKLKLTNDMQLESKRLKMDIDELRTRYYNLDISLQKLQHKLLKSCQEQGINVQIVKSLSEGGKPLGGMQDVVVSTNDGKGMFSNQGTLQETLNYNTQTYKTNTMTNSEDF